MKEPILKAVSPVWAQNIEVERRAESLWITGRGHSPSPIALGNEKDGSIKRLDLLQRFRNYKLKHLGQKTRKGAGIYQLADADNDQSLFLFCSEYGPLDGKVHSMTHEESGMYTLVVEQNLDQLRQEQRRFRSATLMVQQLNRNGKADRTAIWNAISELERIDSKVLGTVFITTESLPIGKSNTEKTADLIQYGNIILCDVLNQFRPELFAMDRRAIELPLTQSTGILHAIYFQLRLDYLAQRTIGTCLQCGGHFPVYRRDGRACKPYCQKALRNSKYWSENKGIINDARREKRGANKE